MNDGVILLFSGQTAEGKPVDDENIRRLNEDFKIASHLVSK